SSAGGGAGGCGSCPCWASVSCAWPTGSAGAVRSPTSCACSSGRVGRRPTSPPGRWSGRRWAPRCWAKYAARRPIRSRPSRGWRVRRMTSSAGLGLGVGWRPELAAPIHRRPDLGFVEIVAEAFAGERPLPLALRNLMRRGVAVVPHGVRLSLGGSERLDRDRVVALAGLAERVGAPLVSEHVAFVRGGGVEA